MTVDLLARNCPRERTEMAMVCDLLSWSQWVLGMIAVWEEYIGACSLGRFKEQLGF